MQNVEAQLESVHAFYEKLQLLSSEGSLSDDTKTYVFDYLTGLDDLSGNALIMRAAQVIDSIGVKLIRAKSWIDLEPQMQAMQQLTDLMDSQFVTRRRLLVTPEQYGISSVRIKLIGGMVSPAAHEILADFDLPTDGIIMHAKLFGVHKSANRSIDNLYTDLCSRGYISDMLMPSHRARTIGEYIYSPLLPTQLQRDVRLISWTHNINEA